MRLGFLKLNYHNFPILCSLGGYNAALELSRVVFLGDILKHNGFKPPYKFKSILGGIRLKLFNSSVGTIETHSGH